MTSTMKTLGIDQLSVEERPALVQDIWDSIATEPGSTPLSDARRTQLERRLTEHERAPRDVVLWDDVKTDALKRLQK